MNKSLIAAILLAISAAGALYAWAPASSERDLFNEWSDKLGETFTGEELVYRAKVFQDNLRIINEHNSKVGKKHELGLNQFAFLTAEEFRAKYLSSFNAPTTVDQVIAEEEQEVNGPTIDWVSYGAVSPVKNQGACGATYAFSAVGAVEGVSVIFYKTQQEYSVQQVIDCSQGYGNAGCNTGNMENSFNYIRNVGLNTEAAYPYRGLLQACQASSGLFKIKSYTNVKDCTSLANALTGRPISVAVDGANFQLYRSGVFYNCGTNLSLAALLVGMTDAFWNVKLSWGSTWGENGYIRLGRGNTCGICQVASYPVVWSTSSFISLN